jgi:hypothetical protein
MKSKSEVGEAHLLNKAFITIIIQDNTNKVLACGTELPKVSKVGMVNYATLING